MSESVPPGLPHSRSAGVTRVGGGRGLHDAYRLPVEQVLAVLGVDPAAGLSTAEAQARQAQTGRNLLPSVPPVPAWRRFLAQFQDPLTILLLVATVVSHVAWLSQRDT